MEAEEGLWGYIVLSEGEVSGFLELSLFITIVSGDNSLYIGAVFYAVCNAGGDGVSSVCQ